MRSTERAREADDERQRVNLVKCDALMGGLPVGTQFEVLVDVGTTHYDAITRAFRMLKREHPAENAMCWEVDGG